MHLEGNQLTCNQVIFLIHQMRIPYRRSFPIEQRHHLFPHLRVLNLNSGRERVACRVDNLLGNEGVKQLFTLFRYQCFPELEQVFLLSTPETRG